jgi:DNA-binding protein Fis
MSGGAKIDPLYITQKMYTVYNTDKKYMQFFSLSTKLFAPKRMKLWYNHISTEKQGLFMVDNKINEYYRHVEVKLEDIVDKLLKSKVNDHDNILLNVQCLIEKVFIKSAMKLSDNNVSKASKLLGINRNTLSKKVRETENTKHQPQKRSKR